MAVSLRVKNIEQVTEAMALGSARPVITVNLSITGPAAAYALVWEWGRVDCNPGPKTLWGSNPDGDVVVLTKTAPAGYIRVNRSKYRDIIREEIANIRWRKLKPSQWNSAVTHALERAALRCADLISETAPIDTGELRRAIKISKASPEPLDQLKLRVGVSK